MSRSTVASSFLGSTLAFDMLEHLIKTDSKFLGYGSTGHLAVLTGQIASLWGVCHIISVRSRSWISCRLLGQSFSFAFDKLI